MNPLSLQTDIQQTGNKLASEGSDAGPVLRRLQSLLPKRNTNQPQLNFLSFFLFNFIDDIYFNLSGDFPYTEQSKQIIDEFYRLIGNHLIKLGQEFDQLEYKPLFNIYTEMVGSYYDTLNQLESIAKG